jgi:hypothetical protein
MRLIDFIGIGVRKAASGWLYDSLLRHPLVSGVRPSLPKKEVDFFQAHYEKGYPWYHRQFDWSGQVVGEFSGGYLSSSDAARRIHLYNPGIRLLVILRDPVSRSISDINHLVMRGHLPDEISIREAVEQCPAIVEQGLYARGLTHFVEHFPQSQLLFIDFDDVKTTPEGVIGDAIEFLGLKPSYLSTMPEKSNVPSRTTKPLVRKGLRSLGNASSFILPASTTERLRKGAVASKVRDRTRQPLSTIRRHSSSEEEWLYTMFASDIDLLESLLGRDFSKWRR